MRTQTRSLIAALLFSLACAGRTPAQAPTVTSISPNSGAVGSSVAITGTNFGSAQGSSTIKLNGTTALVANWSNTSIVAVVPANATSGLFSVTVNGQTANSSSFSVTALPSGWSDGDIGTVGIAGSASYSNGTFTVQGAGTVGGNADGFNFAYQSLSGDGTILARVLSMQGFPCGTVGVMIRESLNANSTNAYVEVGSIYTGSIRNTNLIYRSTTGGSSSSAHVYIPNLPYYVKLVRAGNSFTGSVSADLFTWVPISNVSITMAQNVYVGLAVSSSSTTNSTTATFDSVSVSSSAMSAPAIATMSATTGSAGTQIGISGTNFGASEGSSVVTINGVPMTINAWSASAILFTVPAGATSGSLFVFTGLSMNASSTVYFTVTSQPLPTEWLDQDVGQIVTQGSAIFSNGIFTAKGSGLLWSGQVGDGFHFAYQRLSGDGSIVAGVASLTPADGNSKVGVMIRETLTAGSTYAGVFMDPGPNQYTLYRTTTGASSGLSGGNPGYKLPLPCWMKVVRSGNTFTGYLSADNVNWVQVGMTQTISMAQSVYVGLAVSGNTSSSLSTATFDGVSINTTADPTPVITVVSATTGSIGSQVTITGSNFGASQGAGLVTVNGSPLAINFWSSTSIVATIPTGATSGPLLVSVGPDANDSNPVYFTVTTQPLPVGWLDTDIGDAIIGGSANYANGTFTVNGIGALYGGGTSGMFHLAYQSMSGDGSVVARVLSVQGGGSYKSAGVMIQETLAPTTTFLSTMSDGAPNAFLLYRTSTGVNPGSGGGASETFPYWIKVVRSGSTFSGYRSADGVNWTQVGTNQTISMAQNVYVLEWFTDRGDGARSSAIRRGSS